MCRYPLLIFGETQQGARVAGFDMTRFEVFPHARVQLQQPEQIADGNPRAADRFGSLLVGQPKLIEQTLKASRLLDGVEVFALDIFDETYRQSRFVGTRRTTAGTSVRPANCAARQRRSPAISS